MTGVVMGHSEYGAVKGACDAAQIGLLSTTLASINPVVTAVEGYSPRSSKNAAFVQAVAEMNVRLGGLNYFQGVGKVLRETLAQHGVEAEIVECRTKPTASIRHRADRLIDDVCKNGGLEADELHFVGHSTGGLDAQLIGLAQGARDLFGRDRTRFLDTVTKEVVSLTTDGGEDVWIYLREIASDQGAMVQLMPEALHLFNAAVTDNPDMRYSSLVAIAPLPPSGYNITDLLSLVRTALAGVFILLHTITAREHRHYPYPLPDEAVLEPHREALAYPLDSRSNDGIVPTLSQIHGRVIDIVVADHLDIVGQFRREDLPNGDWLPSGSHFDWARFEAAWGGVAREIMAASSR